MHMNTLKTDLQQCLQGVHQGSEAAAGVLPGALQQLRHLLHYTKGYKMMLRVLVYEHKTDVDQQ